MGKVNRYMNKDQLMGQLHITDSCKDCMYNTFLGCLHSAEFVEVCEIIRKMPVIEIEDSVEK